MKFLYNYLLLFLLSTLNYQYKKVDNPNSLQLYPLYYNMSHMIHFFALLLNICYSDLIITYDLKDTISILNDDCTLNFIITYHSSFTNDNTFTAPEMTILTSTWNIKVVANHNLYEFKYYPTNFKTPYVSDDYTKIEMYMNSTILATTYMYGKTNMTTMSTNNDTLYLTRHAPNNCYGNIYTYRLKIYNNTAIDEIMMSSTIGFTLPYIYNWNESNNHNRPIFIFLYMSICITVAICCLVGIFLLKDRRNKPLDQHLMLN